MLRRRTRVSPDTRVVPASATPQPRSHWRVLVALASGVFLVAVGLSLLIRDHVASDEEPRDRPATSRTLAALLLQEHLDHLALGAAHGIDDVSESGDEEVHLVTWKLSDRSDFYVGVSRSGPEEEAFPTACGVLRSQMPEVLSCDREAVDGVPVLWLSTREDLVGGELGPHGITWMAVRPGVNRGSRRGPTSRSPRSGCGPSQRTQGWA